MPTTKYILLSFAFALTVSCTNTHLKHDTNSPEANHAVATAHPLATKAALDILNMGGNAFDAAIAVSATLAVVEPAGSGLGGGGFWLLHRQSDGKQVMIDGRETAPSKAHADMYLDNKGNVIPKASLNGSLAAGIPGQVAALVHLNKHYGKLPLSINLKAAINHAKNGFAVTKRLQKYLKFRSNIFNPEAKQIFLVNGDIPEIGHIIKQVDLANTLELISQLGNDGFYKGVVAENLIQSVNDNGGIWQHKDLINYQVKERTPITFNYKGARIVSAPPPSSGGIVLGQILKTIELKQQETQQKTPPKMHLIVESMRRAYRDRSLYLGDSDFIKVDQKALLSDKYLRTQSMDIKDVATASENLSTSKNLGTDTTHFSIIDKEGNRVAATLSINYPFGSGHIAEGTGIFLNNEMDDFVSKVGQANVYGLVGGKENQIQAGKRPLSSMSPTFIETDDKTIVLGTPGGSRIISMVALATINLLDKEMSLQAAIDHPRYHHQYLPDSVQLEKASDYTEQQEMIKKGHSFKRLNRKYGDMHAVSREKTALGYQLKAASDSRGEGSAEVQ